MFKPAILFSTHRLDDFVIERFLVTRRATTHRADLHLVVSDTNPHAFPLPDDVSGAMVFVTDADMFGSPPGLKEARQVKPGNSDLKLLAAAHRLRPRQYTHYLWLEYDVYCAGPEQAAFDALLDLVADHDLVCSYVRPYRPGNQWKWWDSLDLPHVGGFTPWAGFTPIMGISSALLQSLEGHVRRGARGHWETLMPTIARLEGFSIADLADEPHTLVTRDQFAAPPRARKTGGLSITAGVPFVHPVKDRASLQRLSKPDAAASPIRVTQRKQSSFPRVGSWHELLESDEDCILLLPRQARATPQPARDWLSGRRDYFAAGASPSRQTARHPLNDLPPGQPYCLCLHNATVVVPRPAPTPARHGNKPFLLTSRNEIVADSFFRYQSLPHTLTAGEAGEWIMPGEALRGATEITAPTLFADLIAGHFGHVLLEGLARLWPLNHQNGPDPAALLFSGHGIMGAHRFRDAIPAWILEFFAACEIPAESLHLLHATTRFRKLLVPRRISALFTGDYGPELDLLMRRIGRSITADIEAPLAGPQKLYLSRSRLPPDKRQLPPEQERALDAMFSRLGYEVVHPQDLPIAHQIALVRSAARIAGCAGSQMALLQFCEPPAPPAFVIAGAHNPGWVQSIYAEKRGRVDFFVVPADRSETTLPAYRSPWRIDAEQMECLADSLVRWEREVPADCAR